jgi:glycosyltransferase involved in cell wall biosynthesis
MHNITNIKIFNVLLWISYPFAFIFIYPFALLKKKNPSGLFFFFDRYAIGGAQRIHIDILNSVDDTYKQVFFTRKSPDDKLKEEFYSIANTDSKDIHFWCDNLLFRLFSVHYYVFYINRHTNNARVFGANSTFFYDMLPFLKNSSHKIELLHNFTFGKKGMEFFGLANHKYLDTRIVYDSYTLSNIEKQYQQYHIDKKYLNRILFIEPGVDIPGVYPKKDFSLPLKILYAGRGGVQKRIHLINEIVQRSVTENLPVIFHFAGSMIDELSSFTKEHSIIHGEISRREKMYALYDEVQIILLVSAYEGFPMFIKEAMACGCVPVVTALPGNKMHLQDGGNALLINAIENEKEVVEQGIQKIRILSGDINLLKKISGEAYYYASRRFTKLKFTEDYRTLLLS